MDLFRSARVASVKSNHTIYRTKSLAFFVLFDHYHSKRYSSEKVKVNVSEESRKWLMHHTVLPQNIYSTCWKCVSLTISVTALSFYTNNVLY